MTLILNVTKESGNKKTIYGKQNDAVEIIVDYGEVLIVEHTRTKIRFSVKKSEVNNI